MGQGTSRRPFLVLFGLCRQTSAGKLLNALFESGKLWFGARKLDGTARHLDLPRVGRWDGQGAPFISHDQKGVLLLQDATSLPSDEPACGPVC